MCLKNLIRSQSDFATRLAGKFLVRGKDNVVFSPSSINTVVGLIAAGASGATLDQTLAFLNLEKKEELEPIYNHVVGTTFADGSMHGGPRLSFANGVWLDKSMKLHEPFKKIASGAFKAFTREVDFQNKANEVRAEVNSWAKKETHGLIQQILPPGSVDPIFTGLIIANALYFKGTWENKFKVSDTEPDDFHTLDGEKVRVPFMTSRKKQYVSAFDGFKVLKLPYNHGKDGRYFSMYIYLPDAKDGLESLVGRMCSEHGFLNKYVPLNQVTPGEFKIPKFKFSYQLELSEELKDMGLVLPFKPGGLMEMIANPVDGEDFIRSIYHNSLIEVDEEGTEAASFTRAFGFGAGCARPVFLDFVADHPFAFVIKEKRTDVVLFAGSVVNPLEKN